MFVSKTKETQTTLMTIVEAYPKSLGGAADKSDDEIVMEIAIDISEKLVKFIDVDLAHSTIMKTDDKGRLPSLSTVLMQEIERFNKLLDVIHHSLNDLRKAIKGFVVMSAELEGVYTAFMNNTVILFYLIRFTVGTYFVLTTYMKKNIIGTENVAQQSISFVEDIG